MNEQPEQFVPESLRDARRDPPLPRHSSAPSAGLGAKTLFAVATFSLFYFLVYYKFLAQSSDPNQMSRALTEDERWTHLIGIVVSLGFMMVGAILSLRNQRRES